MRQWQCILHTCGGGDHIMMRGQSAKKDGPILLTHVFEFAQGRNVDQRGGGFYTALQLYQDIGATSYNSRLSCVLLKQFQRSLETRRLYIVLPHDYLLVFQIAVDRLSRDAN